MASSNQFVTKPGDNKLGAAVGIRRNGDPEGSYLSNAHKSTNNESITNLRMLAENFVFISRLAYARQTNILMTLVEISIILLYHKD